MGYKKDVGEVIDCIDDVITNIKDEVDNALTVASKLHDLINEDEYDADIAYTYASYVVDRLQEIWDNLKKLRDDLY
jgi:hypothetical protein